MMSHEKRRQIRVSTQGIAQRTANMLSMFFQSACENAFVLVDDGTGEACIIDLDGYRGRTLWKEFRESNPGVPLILLSLHAEDVSDEIILRKPIKSNLLADALKEVKAKLRGNPPAVTEERKTEQRESVAEVVDLPVKTKP